MGEAHEKTKESSEYLKYLTQQAVALQRTMNEIYKNGSNASITPLKVRTHVGFFVCVGDHHRIHPKLLRDVFSLPPVVQFTAPSMASILEQLNIINGIIFIPLRYGDMWEHVGTPEFRKILRMTCYFSSTQMGWYNTAYKSCSEVPERHVSGPITAGGPHSCDASL